MKKDTQGIKLGSTPGTDVGTMFSNSDGWFPTDNPAYSYKEFDVFNQMPGVRRDGHRFILQTPSGAIFYTPDHYQTIYQITDRNAFSRKRNTLSTIPSSAKDNSIDYKNKISFVIDENELRRIQDYYASRPNSHFVIIQGDEVQTRADYLKVIQREFRFHWFDPPEFIDGYLDWMKDLSWLEKDEIGVLFVNFNQFAEQNPSLKIAIIVAELQETILPAWEQGAHRFICDDVPTSFQVYIWDKPFEMLQSRGD